MSRGLKQLSPRYTGDKPELPCPNEYLSELLRHDTGAIPGYSGCAPMPGPDLLVSSNRPQPPTVPNLQPSPISNRFRTRPFRAATVRERTLTNLKRKQNEHNRRHSRTTRNRNPIPHLARHADLRNLRPKLAAKGLPDPHPPSGEPQPTLPSFRSTLCGSLQKPTRRGIGSITNTPPTASRSFCRSLIGSINSLTPSSASGSTPRYAAI